MRGLTVFILGFILIPGCSFGDTKTITVWNYHDFPPYEITGEPNANLSADLAEWMTRESEGKYEFTLTHIPRERLNALLEKGESGIVLWANPVWFDDPERTRFLWTSPLMLDKDIIVSHSDSPIEYKGPRSLEGKRVAAVRGYHFPNLAPLVEQGHVERVNIARERNGLRMLAHQRPIDATIISELAARYIAKQLGITDELHFSENPLRRYNRHLMITPDLPEVAEFVRQALSRLHGTRKWCELQKAYGIAKHQDWQPGKTCSDIN